MSKIIWAEPVATLARALREEARTIRTTLGDDSHADLLERIASRMDAAIEAGADCEYVDSSAAAEFLDIGEEAVRARCRRRLRAAGLARKRGGRWEIHASVLAA